MPFGANIAKTRRISYKRGIFKGDFLIPLLFRISLLRLSIEFRRGSGYMAVLRVGVSTESLTCLDVDDLKRYVPSEKNILTALEIFSEYTTVIGMSFELDKCDVYHVHRGQGLKRWRGCSSDKWEFIW